MEIAIGIYHVLFEPIPEYKVDYWNQLFETNKDYVRISKDGRLLYKIMYRLPLDQFKEIGGMTMNIKNAVNFLNITRKYPSFVISNQFEFFAIPIINNEIPLENWLTR